MKGTHDPFKTSNLPNLSGEDDNESIANVFCFGTFADRNSGIVYHDLTGLVPFMLYDGSVCFFILYHYESNAIIGTPIAGIEDISIFEAYKKQFENLVEKGFKPKINVMDNQVTKHIKKILIKNECKLQLVEPSCNPDIQGCIYRSAGHHRQQLFSAIMGLAHAASPGHAKYDAYIKNQPSNFWHMKPQTGHTTGTDTPWLH